MRRWYLKLAVMQSRWTGGQLSRLLGHDGTWLSKVIAGVLDPTAEEETRLAAMLDAPRDRLFAPVERVAV